MANLTHLCCRLAGPAPDLFWLACCSAPCLDTSLWGLRHSSTLCLLVSGGCLLFQSANISRRHANLLLLYVCSIQDLGQAHGGPRQKVPSVLGHPHVPPTPPHPCVSFVRVFSWASTRSALETVFSFLLNSFFLLSKKVIIMYHAYVLLYSIGYKFYPLVFRIYGS